MKPNLGLIAGQLGFDELGLAVLIHAVHGKNILGEINSYRDNAHDSPLSWG